MTDADVTVVDYGVGNLLSVRRALEHCGARVDVTGEPRRVAEAARVVLPGVGAFGGCMDELRRYAMVDAVLAFAARERPFLGICVGMQLLLDEGEEFGTHEGLGLIAGRVEPIPPGGADGRVRRLPNVGWRELKPCGTAWSHSLLADAAPGTAVYFCHSFRACPASDEVVIARSDYEGLDVPAMLRQGHLHGVQFHPEKSGPAGLSILRRFLRI